MTINPKFSLVLLLLLGVIISACVTSPPNTQIPIYTTALSTSTDTAPVLTPTISSTPFSSSGKMVVNFIDVGQGDSEFIQFPNGKTMLIDAGPTSSATTVTSYLQSLGVKSIDIVVATHPHEDHIGGMSSVLNTFTVGQFIDSGTPSTSSVFEKMLNLIDQKNIPFKTVSTGDTITIDPSVDIRVLSPSSLDSSDYNQNSIVLKMVYEKTSFLFTGDGAEPVEQQYANAAGHVDILKVAHHGSCTSSYSSFLSVIRPSISVISVGAHNSYGHPCLDTINRLTQIGSTVYRTDQNGNIVITSDGITYSVNGVSSTPGSNPIEQTQSSTQSVVQPVPIITTVASTQSISPSCTVNYQTGTCPSGKCWTRDYCKKDGTHVNGYCRKC